MLKQPRLASTSSHKLKQRVKPLIPNAILRIRDGWRRQQFEERLRRAAAIDPVVAQHCRNTVIAGPFEGMRYGAQAFCGGYAPKLLGCYEAELHRVVADAVSRDYKVIVDIGAAEGYYAVGFARRCPQAQVFAFEIDEQAQILCREMINLNNVADRVTLKRACTIEALRLLPLRGALLICDCEGGEFDLLRPDAVPDLAFCDVLVEMHDYLDARITPTLLERFDQTHEVMLVESHPHDPADFPAVGFLPRHQRASAVDDLRGATMQWAWMTARSRVPDRRSSPNHLGESE
jgi:hypothetical protein